MHVGCFLLRRQSESKLAAARARTLPRGKDRLVQKTVRCFEAVGRFSRKQKKRLFDLHRDEDAAVAALYQNTKRFTCVLLNDLAEIIDGLDCGAVDIDDDVAFSNAGLVGSSLTLHNEKAFGADLALLFSGQRSHGYAQLGGV